MVEVENLEELAAEAPLGQVVRQASPTRQMVEAERAEAESEVPCPLVKRKFCKEEEAVVEVAKRRAVPIRGDSKPEEKVEEAVEVPTKAPAVNGV